MASGVTIADWIVAACTVAALLIAAWQLRASAQAAGQTHARSAWMEYLRLGLANPDLGEERFALSRLKLNGIEDLVSGDSLESQRYLWFLSVLMEACESLIIYFPTTYWKLTIAENLSFHREAIKEIWPQEKALYSSEMQDIVEEVIYRAKPPPSPQHDEGAQT